MLKVVLYGCPTSRPPVYSPAATQVPARDQPQLGTPAASSTGGGLGTGIGTASVAAVGVPGTGGAAAAAPAAAVAAGPTSRVGVPIAGAPCGAGPNGGGTARGPV